MQILGNGTLITLNAEKPLIENGAVAYEDGRIADFGETAALRAAWPEADFLDAEERLILPGFINLHTHIYSAFARGLTVPGAPPSPDFMAVLENLWWRLDVKLNHEDVRQSAYATYIDSIKNGVTTVFDHHAGFDGLDGSLFVIGEVARELGIRTSLCFEVSDRNGEDVMRASVRENMDWIHHVAAQGDETQKGLFGLHASFTLSDETLDYCREQAGDAGFHVHAAEGIGDVHKTLAMSGKRVVERLFDHGMLGEKSLCIHCVHVNPAEMELLRETNTPVIHNPQSNMGNAVGASPVAEMLRRGLLVGMGTDAYTADMTESLKNANTLGKHHLCDPSAMWAEAPRMLLENNREIAGRHFGLPLGIIKKGAAADLITVDYYPPTPLTEGNIASHLLFGVYGRSVDTTIIGGETRMRGRALCGLDEAGIMAKARAQAADLWKRL